MFRRGWGVMPHALARNSRDLDRNVPEYGGQAVSYATEMLVKVSDRNSLFSLC